MIKAVWSLTLPRRGVRVIVAMQQYPAHRAVVQPGTVLFRQHGLEAAAKLLLSASGAISAAGEALLACSEQQESLSEGTRALLASLTRAAKQLEGDNALLGQCITIVQSLGDIASRYLYGYRNCSTEELPGVTEDLLGALQRWAGSRRSLSMTSALTLTLTSALTAGSAAGWLSCSCPSAVPSTKSSVTKAPLPLSGMLVQVPAAGQGAAGRLPPVQPCAGRGGGS